MPDEEELPEGWGELLFGDVTSTAMMRAVKADDEVPKLTGVPMGSTRTESLEDYQARLFKEYFKAKEDLDEDVTELTFEGFLKKLESHSARLKKKHKAKEIRFSVVVRDEKVVLKPQPIF